MAGERVTPNGSLVLAELEQRPPRIVVSPAPSVFLVAAELAGAGRAIPDAWVQARARRARAGRPGGARPGGLAARRGIPDLVTISDDLDLDRMVAALELQRERPGIEPLALAPLTPREIEVAVLIVDGLADREIAQRLYLSHHTVSQYVKRIYRKLDVGSRVGLTRLLLGAT